MVPKFEENDPLSVLHVPRRKRKNVDGGEGSNAIDEKSGDDTDFDREEIKTIGPIRDESELQ